MRGQSAIRSVTQSLSRSRNQTAKSLIRPQTQALLDASYGQRQIWMQVATAAVVVGVGFAVRNKWQEIRSMRPDLNTEPLDPSSPQAELANFHEGGFRPVMDKKEASMILGVRENASKEKIMARYRTLMKSNHPDLGGSPFISSKINEAKELLSKTARSELEKSS